MFVFDNAARSVRTFGNFAEVWSQLFWWQVCVTAARWTGRDSAASFTSTAAAARRGFGQGQSVEGGEDVATLRLRAFGAFTAIGLILCAGALFHGSARAQGVGTNFPQCENFNWISLGFRSERECVILLAARGKIWHLADDFLFSPDQENPNPDSHGNADVWWFQYNPNGLERDPASFVTFPHFTIFDDDREHWDNGATTPLVGIHKNLNTMLLHPGSNQLVVTGWQSPVSGRVNIRGGFRHVGGPGENSNGVRWFVDHDNGTNTVPLDSGVLEIGESADFGFEFTADVEVGDFLYFSVDPRPNGGTRVSNFDTTQMNLTISGPVRARRKFVDHP